MDTTLLQGSAESCSSTTNCRGCHSSPQHNTPLQFLRVIGCDAAIPADGCKANCTWNNRLSVTFQIQYVIKVNVEVLVALHQLHLFPQDGDGVQLSRGPPEVQHHPSSWPHSGRGGCSQQSTSSLCSVSSTVLTHPTTVESSENFCR